MLLVELWINVDELRDGIGARERLELARTIRLSAGPPQVLLHHKLGRVDAGAHFHKLTQVIGLPDDQVQAETLRRPGLIRGSSCWSRSAITQRRGRTMVLFRARQSLALMKAMAI